jgi:hypothetical protein
VLDDGGNQSINHTNINNNNNQYRSRLLAIAIQRPVDNIIIQHKLRPWLFFIDSSSLQSLGDAERLHIWW